VVREFHTTFDLARNDVPTWPPAELAALRQRLLVEETAEVGEAVAGDDVGHRSGIESEHAANRLHAGRRVLPQFLVADQDPVGVGAVLERRPCGPAEVRPHRREPADQRDPPLGGDREGAAGDRPGAVAVGVEPGVDDVASIGIELIQLDGIVVDVAGWIDDHGTGHERVLRKGKRSDFTDEETCCPVDFENRSAGIRHEERVDGPALIACRACGNGIRLVGLKRLPHRARRMN